jgi:homogentisate 1,2-dioxygenase
MEDTFQLPYFHRNTMSEFSGVLSGGSDLSRVPQSKYEMSALHNNLSPHGLDVHEVEAAMRKPLVPERIPDDTKAFVIDSWYVHSVF